MKTQFSKDCERGRQAELLVHGLLEHAGIPSRDNSHSRMKPWLTRLVFSCEPPLPQSLSDWDLVAQLEDCFTVEVKSDEYESRSGNIALEYWNPKKNEPSGILSSRADLWVYVLANPVTAWVCRSRDLRRWFESAHCARDILLGGDLNAALKLYPREEILAAVFHRIDHLDVNPLRGLLGELLA